MWQQWITALLGLFTIAVPFMDLTASTLTWTLAAVGIAVAVLAIWGGAEEQAMERRLQHQ
jgi:hypothetical protein